MKMCRNRFVGAGVEARELQVVGERFTAVARRRGRRSDGRELVAPQRSALAQLQREFILLRRRQQAKFVSEKRLDLRGVVRNVAPGSGLKGAPGGTFGLMVRVSRSVIPAFSRKAGRPWGTPESGLNSSGDSGGGPRLMDCQGLSAFGSDGIFPRRGEPDFLPPRCGRGRARTASTRKARPGRAPLRRCWDRGQP